MYEYYTGIVFKGYTYGTGDEVVTGGRYDNLLMQFGKDFAAIGFAINLDQLMVALERQHIIDGNKEKKLMVLYSVEDKAAAIEYTKKLRSEKPCVMMVRKRSCYSIEDYTAYAKRQNVSQMFIIDENGDVKTEDLDK
jgi:ATP phosphoribosyltransferase regulatory subunit